MFNFLKKKSGVDFGWIGVDMHAHLLPGIDDGVKEVAEAVGYLKKLMALGYERFIITPHVYDEVHPNTPETIGLAHKRLREALEREGLHQLYTYASAEYMLGDGFDTILENNQLLGFPNRYLLVENSLIAEPLQLDQTLLQIRLKGYKPIVAHPERYLYYFNRPQAYHRLKEMGCLLQLNLLSPTGYYGKEVAKAAQYLIKNKLYDLAGTDFHHERHWVRLKKYAASGQAYKDLGHLKLKNRDLLYV